MLKRTFISSIIACFSPFLCLAAELNLSNFNFKINFDDGRFVESKTSRPEVLFLIQEKSLLFPTFNAVIIQSDYTMPSSMSSREKILESYVSAGLQNSKVEKECGNNFANLTLRDQVLLLSYENNSEKFINKVAIVPFNQSQHAPSYLTFTEVHKVMPGENPDLCRNADFNVTFEEKFAASLRKQPEPPAPASKASTTACLIFIVVILSISTTCYFYYKTQKIDHRKKL